MDDHFGDLRGDLPGDMGLSRLQAEVDSEIDEVESSLDPVDADEPVAVPYEIRLRALHGAVVAMEALEEGHDLT